MAQADSLNVRVEYALRGLAIIQEDFEAAIKRGTLSKAKMRYTISRAVEAREVVLELRGAMEAFRACAVAGRDTNGQQGEPAKP